MANVYKAFKPLLDGASEMRGAQRERVSEVRAEAPKGIIPKHLNDILVSLNDEYFLQIQEKALALQAKQQKDEAKEAKKRSKA